MLEKGTIRWTIHCKDQFVSHLFLVWRRTRATERWRATTINLKDFNIFIHYKHFKMEKIYLLKEILKLSMQVWPEKRLFFGFYRTKSQGNMYAWNGRVPCTN